MRLQKFHDLIAAEFGGAHGGFIVTSHVLASLGDTPANLLDKGVDPREIWIELCKDFDVPKERWLGPDE
ncbi:DUF3046 domain-containing protein [Corynebacterium aquilae]|uniref:Signal transduction histidine kinase n=1 Tax=Corynebacterium aquilae DSM 44791 TaxID=1431546 RepID=A0A1L7CGE4_9CORY|nr:DUF3046 domain-containing protein [Corynebacterium aquilae]APT84932.1 hypothetical protein CAQU_07480 [Corynebacterium aquilae DSM 44791]